MDIAQLEALVLEALEGRGWKVQRATSRATLLPPGVSEVFAHPVTDGEELRAYDTQNADIRAHDAACLTDPAVSDLLDRHDIKRISFRELRELQRAGGTAFRKRPRPGHGRPGAIPPDRLLRQG